MADIPYERRTTFCIGNLGWDETEEVIESRAKEILALCGVVTDDCIGPVASRRKGSTADCQFHDAAKGAVTRMKCKMLKKSFVKDTRTNEPRMVWIDAKKTMNELAPGRRVRKFQQVMQIFEDQKSDRMDLTVNLRELTVIRDRAVMVSFRAESPIFTKIGMERFTNEERLQIGSAM